MDQSLSSSAKREVANPRGVVLKRPGPPGGVRDTNRQQKSQTIRDAALELFLQRGIEGVSVDDIMKSADMAKGSFYRYFSDQEGLVADLIAPLAEQVTTALDQCAAQLRAVPVSAESRASAFETLFSALSRVVTEQKGQVRLYLQENRAPGVGARRPIIELMKQISSFAIDIAEHDPSGAHPPVVALALVGSTERLLLALALNETVGEPANFPSALRRVIEAMKP
jgi:AcrR family transcriptional regulator